MQKARNDLTIFAEECSTSSFIFLFVGISLIGFLSEACMSLQLKDFNHKINRVLWNGIVSE